MNYVYHELKVFLIEDLLKKESSQFEIVAQVMKDGS